MLLVEEDHESVYLRMLENCGITKRMCASEMNLSFSESCLLSAIGHFLLMLCNNLKQLFCQEFI